MQSGLEGTRACRVRCDLGCEQTPCQEAIRPDGFIALLAYSHTYAEKLTSSACCLVQISSTMKKTVHEIEEKLPGHHHKARVLLK